MSCKQKERHMSILQNLLRSAGTVLAIYPRTSIRKNKYFVQSGSASEAIKKDFERVGYGFVEGN